MAGPILVFGRNGQVARELAGLGGSDRAMVFAGRETLDLADHASIDGLIARIA